MINSPQWLLLFSGTRYPDIPAAASLVVALGWVADTSFLGLAAAIFFIWIAMLCILVDDTWKFARRMISVGCPRRQDRLRWMSVLLLTPPAPALAPAPTHNDLHLTLGKNITSILCSTFCIVSHVLTAKTIFLERPILGHIVENTGTILEYMFEGSEVLLGLFLGLLVVAAVRQQSDAAASSSTRAAPAVVTEEEKA
ncbi:hypothetical protein C8R45DRAFT_923802 [Mycena sanguinolenta]|nr:hypothetical protein C8R45DRAFT_923802 [Mycena sanguinolenta]